MQRQWEARLGNHHFYLFFCQKSVELVWVGKLLLLIRIVLLLIIIITTSTMFFPSCMNYDLLDARYWCRTPNLLPTPALKDLSQRGLWCRHTSSNPNAALLSRWRAREAVLQSVSVPAEEAVAPNDDTLKQSKVEMNMTFPLRSVVTKAGSLNKLWQSVPVCALQSLIICLYPTALFA